MPLEIERKFLIALPDTDFLGKLPGCRVKRIRQTYLEKIPGTKTERRIRRIEEDGAVSFVFTKKDKITKITRREEEREITEEEYRALYGEAKKELTKTRYAFPFGGHVVEIDVYPYEIGGDGLVGKAVLEVELESEREEFSLPDFIRIERELTGTKEFSNKTMAKKIRGDRVPD